jgi:hypothetical protein
VEWENKYPLVSVRALPKLDSDHTTLILDFGLRPQICYRLELCWLLRPDVKNVLIKAWSDPFFGKSLIDIWQKKMRNVRRKFKCWNINWEGFNKKQKKFLIEQIDYIDRKSEI